MNYKAYAIHNRYDKKVETISALPFADPVSINKIGMYMPQRDTQGT